MGVITGLCEGASLEWCLTHCYYTNKDEFIKNHKTHMASLLCDSCGKEPYLKFNLAEKQIECCLCGAINLLD